jgi:hypothetical protein
MRKLFIGAILLLAVASCKKQGEMLTVNENANFSAGLQASADSVTLAPANDSSNVLTLTWPAVNYGKGVAVTYTLELDVPGDTAGESGWSKAVSYAAGADVLTWSFMGQDLNNELQTLGLYGPTPLVFRVLGNVTQYNGSASTIPTSYSSVTTVVVTPYTTNLYVPSAYQGWNPATAPTIGPAPGYPGIFEGYVNIAGSGAQQFKFTNSPDWNHTNYGDSTGNLMTTNGNAGGMTVPNGAYYELSANLNTNTWSIIGDATPGGWNTDTQMSYNPTTQVWTVTAAMLSAGSYKFRANDAWVIDFGIDNSGNLQYADNPLFTYNPNLNNLTVPANGTYLITLDLHIAGKYTYSALLQ